MMYTFLANNRDELIDRCKGKVAARPRRAATDLQLRNGIPLFLQQLERTLRAEEIGDIGQTERISGGYGERLASLSEMSVSAIAHGKQLLQLGYTVDQVVHDYGDLCQAITELAVERDAPFAVDEFRTLNRCLDNAIADAVTEFSEQRDLEVATRHAAEANERLGFLVHEVRNVLSAATLAVRALEMGNLPISGATGSVLKRSLTGLTALTDRALAEVRLNSDLLPGRTVCQVASLINDVRATAMFDANLRSKGLTLEFSPVDPSLKIMADCELLTGALGNIVQNALKYTHENTCVKVDAYAESGHVLIDVADHCGGLALGDAETMFMPFSQRSSDKSGLGLGLSIARKNIEANDGALGVRNVPGTGCIFTISLPLHAAAAVS
jgi:signal transduction histidine kinase